ncbi:MULTISPECIES: sulfatase [Pseudonocardia]|uniref:N-sulfoglucosamine sulfohydrolase n=1 Tax=Pseudonocardia alni TaxID=33907 RepID=A0A852W613_PSEA5|nr:MULTISPECIES: sulfatase [Pseudonocardia]MCO7193536.1 sulfatase [Pseudonocardia sp. McavD-2-B]NYG04393.1 N-sulfoglucosamine sulfohydrolase [Pseudonocardia antarctica]
MTASDRRPNILLITVDDMDARSPGCFGGPAGLTPHIDALAATGARFPEAHVVAAVCQPSRSAIMTGRYPHRNGAEGFEPIHDGVPVLTDALREAGYALGILGKVTHLAPVERFGWEHARDMAELGQGRDPGRYRAEAAAFLDTAVAADRPWFLMANMHDPHRPFHGSAAEAEKFGDDVGTAIPAPDLVPAVGEHPLPGFLPDLDGVATEYAQYLASVRRCDQVVGAVTAAVREHGGDRDTVVAFLSDNGMAFPFAKANCYLQSTRTPFVLVWPGVTTPGSVHEGDRFTMLDLLPTFCEVAGVPVPDGAGGSSLGPRLRDGAQPEPDRTVVTVFHETSAQGRYEMRCAQDSAHGYIWNAWSDGERQYRAENMHGLSWAAMQDSTDPSVRARREFYLRRAPEELYALRADPHALSDLATDTAHATVLDDYRERLRSWMTETGDPLLDRFEVEVLGRTAS